MTRSESRVAFREALFALASELVQEGLEATPLQKAGGSIDRLVEKVLESDEPIGLAFTKMSADHDGEERYIALDVQLREIDQEDFNDNEGYESNTPGEAFLG